MLKSVLLKIFPDFSLFDSNIFNFSPQWDVAEVWGQSLSCRRPLWVWKQSPQLPDAGGKASLIWRQGDMGAKLPALGDFCYFLIKICIFKQ